MFSFIWKLWWRPAYLVPMLGASGLWVNIHLLWHGALIFVVLTERPPMFRGLLRQIMRWEPFVSRILRRRPNLKAIFFLLISKDLRSCFIQMFCVLMFSMSVPFLEMLEKNENKLKILSSILNNFGSLLLFEIYLSFQVETVQNLHFVSFKSQIR